MQEYRPLPIGVDSFEKVREGGYYYVDKTLLIKELLDMKGEVNLFTRPRRFGKTLNMTMLREFFQLPEGESEEERQAGAEKQRRLFADLSIMKAGEKYTSQLGQYPVIFLTLKSGKQPTWELAFSELYREIKREFKYHQSERFLQKLSRDEQSLFLKIAEGEAKQVDLVSGLQFLSDCLRKVYGRKAVILIDEYDVPLENAYFCGFYDEMVGFLRALFESALKTNESLAFAVMTGCLRISKESIFTGMNNLKIISVRNSLYAEHFGFTQKEVDTLLRFYGSESSRDEVKKWYDGYLFGETEVYNPWSLINFVEQKYHNPRAFAEPYWANTSGNAVVRSLIEKADSSTKGEIEGLISGGTIEKPVHEDITYGEIDRTMDNLWNFLYFTGYLTRVSERREGESGLMVTLRIPNVEVKYIYESHIRLWFDDKLTHTDLKLLYRATLEGDAAVMEDELNRLLRTSISYMDSRESFYHGFLAGVYQGIGREEYVLKSNRESGHGRYDLALLSLDVREPAVLFELKAAKTYGELAERCEEGLRQIEERNYEEELRSEGYRKILKYSVSFYRKICKVQLAVQEQ